MKRVSTVTVRKRLSYILIAGLFIFFIIDVRLGYVQFGMGKMLTERARDSWSRNIPFEPERGNILDRNGIPIAANQSAPTVFVIPRQIEQAAEAAERLAPVLNMSKEKLYKQMIKNSSIERIAEGRKISFEKAREVQALNLKGVYIAEDSKRHYPFGIYLSQVLGFTGIDNQGLAGLELIYDKELSGNRGSVQFFSDAKGRRMPDMSDDYDPPIDGNDLLLTIDTKIQSIMERELDNAEAKYNPDGAIAIAMDPKTGEILAMSSRPSFNPADFREVPQEVYNRNLPIWSTFEPGSTFKIITLAAALEEGLVDLEHDHFFDPGYSRVGGATLRCWKKGGHGSQSFLEVVENSCNPGFVELGNRLGKDKLFKYIREFGFGQKTGIDLVGEGTGILFRMEQVGPVEAATTAFGQGVSVTPIQQVAAVAAAINGGILYQPYIAKELIDPLTGEVSMRKTPVAKKRVISEKTSKEIRHALESVVAQGTGGNAFIDSYRVGGKTGTAQKAKDGRYMENNHIVSFIGFAPADDPQIVIFVGIDNPKGTIQFGGTVAAPIVKSMMQDALRAMEVKPRKNQIEKERTWLDPIMVEVPDLTGMTRNEIQQQMIDLRLEVSGEGTTVVQQIPEPGVKLEAGSVIRILMK
ncbi:stage V sporulation protein D [Pseudogracilibacillus auburnensis]|uniref:stage V sporulation protein D n=1 Tax=Pseudogracilibacillus auburnensis TaxID=1494959 RepID=UPI001A9607B8|nr:stage V sporulation protein D [Pseudogracilibacillus auburnensis]MBO1004931.1 stage V sporulation protein D [Pseudogracilibacillus auburnensis]